MIILNEPGYDLLQGAFRELYLWPIQTFYEGGSGQNHKAGPPNTDISSLVTSLRILEGEAGKQLLSSSNSIQRMLE